MNGRHDDSAVDTALQWCDTVCGPAKLLSDRTRHHPGERTTALKIGTSAGACYLKIHRNVDGWAQEVHGYEQWAHAFGERAPDLLHVRAEAPLALVVSALPGDVLEHTRLDPGPERAVWRAAGKALAALHSLPPGKYFGPCCRDGRCAATPVADAVEYVAGNLRQNLDRGLAAGYLDPTEAAVVRAAIDRTPAFAGQRPVPCHRDYSPANWLVAPDGTWAGVIDFEFAHWDVAAADWTRYPDWDWIERPDLVEAFFDSYGQQPSAETQIQRLVGLVAYSLSAIVWGQANDYFGFAREGRAALACLAPQLKAT